MSYTPDAQLPKLTLGEWLCIARTRVGISRNELAADLGVPGLVVIRWEEDRVLPNIDQFRDITELCGAEWLWEAVRNGKVLMGSEARAVRALEH
jgi:ribosome-binding protein aMBF1 (putative translation factor)